ncbi:MAG: fimbria/pilus outer membrane usher protein [Gammaproteobacteria bacterium]
MRWLRRNLIIAALGLLTTTGAVSAAESLQLLLADTTVNSVEQGEAFLLWDGVGDFYAAETELTKWRVRRPFPEPVWHDEMPFYRIHDLDGAAAELDMRAMAIVIRLPPRVLERQELRLAVPETPEASASLGLYLDYDVSYMKDTVDRYPFGMLAPTLFSKLGVLNSQFLYRGIDVPLSDTQSQDDFVRLDTTLTRDDPDQLRSYRAGDVLSAPGPWGAAQRIGGLQVASNFGTRPSLVTFPSPYVKGATATPSTVDLFVDGVLRNRQNVEAGFFRIDDLPAITGAGELTLVVTDVMGRETTIIRDFYASSELLKQGLAEYSYSLGFMRRGYGLESNDYGDPAFIGAHRLGIDNSWTVGGRLELSEDVQLIGGTSNWSVRRGGVASTGLAVSNSDDGVGASWLLGYEWLSRDYRLRAQATGSTRDMAVVDPYLNNVPQKLQFAINAGLNRGIIGSLVATYIHQSYWDRDSRDVLTLTYNTRFRDFFVSMYSSVVYAGSSDLMIGMNVSKNFGDRGNTSTYASHRDGDTRVRVESQYRVPVGPGVGYRVGATMANQKQIDGTLIGQSEFGRYTLDARNFDGEKSWRFSTQGSLAWLAGRPYAAREIMDGFAVAKVSEIPNVRVYLENHEIGRTDAKGRILLPALRSYETNRVRIEAEDLPLGAQVDQLELRVAPFYRSGTVVEFPVSVSRQLVLNAMLENGEPVPDGAVVNVDGRDDWSIVGMNGLVYLTGIEGTTSLTLSWLERKCRITVPMPEGNEPLPNVGTQVCEEVEE